MMEDVSALLASHIVQIPLLARIVGFLLISPPFSGRLAPRSAKIGFAVILWLCVADEAPNPTGAHETALLSFMELLVGLMFGFFVQLMFIAFDVVGALLANGMGLSVPGSFDPVAAQSAGPVAGLTQMLAISIFISSGGLEMSTAYLIDSFRLMPPGETPTIQGTKNHAFALLTHCLMLGITSSVAIWGSLLLANGLMLIAARLAGGLNLMNSGLPLLLIIGLLLLALQLAPTLNNLWSKLPPLSEATAQAIGPGP